MSILLAAPAVGLILLQALPFKRAMNAAFLMAQVQVDLSSAMDGEYCKAKLMPYSRSLLPFRFYQPMRKAISHGHLSSLVNSCSNGPSIGDLLGKKDFCPGNLL